MCVRETVCVRESVGGTGIVLCRRKGLLGVTFSKTFVYDMTK